LTSNKCYVYKLR